MALTRQSRSRSRDFHREQQKPENRVLDTEREMTERRERRREQLKNDRRHQKRLAREAKAEARQARRDAAEEEARREPTPRELHVRRRNRWIYGLTLLLFLGFLGGAVWKAVRVKAQETEAAAREERLQSDLAKLRDELSRVDDPEYIEEKARTELHMVFPGETLYIIKGRQTKTADGDPGADQ